MRQYILSSVFTAAFSLCACSSSGSVNNFLQDEDPPMVVVPSIPSSLDFAGEKVPLENYDTRESLEEDMSVTMYMHSRTLKTLRSTTRFFPIIEPILEKHGIPKDFKYLAMAESGLNPESYSPAKAAGLWQILPATATSLGLEVNVGVDERYHTEKATVAACKYLKDAYASFGDWTMVAASYNAGVAGVRRRSDSQNQENYYDLFLPTETMRYVFRVLSFKLLTANPQQYGFVITKEQYYPAYEYDEVKESSAIINWSDVAAANGTNYKILREMNPWIRGYEHQNKLGKTYVLKIPKKGFRTGK